MIKKILGNMMFSENRNKAFALAFFVTIWLASMGCGLASAADDATPYFKRPAPRNLILTGDSDYAPMEFLVKDGKSRGILVDIWKLWAKKTGVSIDYRCMSIKEAAAKVLSGEAHAIAGLAFSGEKNEDFLLTKPYLSINTSIFFHKSVYGVKDIGDLAGFRVGFVKGDDFSAYLSEHPKSVITVMFDSHEGMVRAAVSGEIRAFVCDLPVGLYFLSQFGGRDVFRYVREPVHMNPIMAGVRKDRADIALMIENGFKQISDQEIQDIVNNWTGEKNIFFVYWHFLIAAAVLALVLIVSIFRIRTIRAIKRLEKRNRELSDEGEKARENGEGYRSLAENSTDFILRFDESSKIIYANPRASILAGGPEGRLVTKTVYEIGLSSSVSILFANTLKTVFAEKTIQRLDFQIQSGKWLDCFFIPEPSDNGDQMTVLVTGRDITEIKMVEEDLRDGEGKYRSLVENTPGAVYRCRKDESWIIEFVSDAIGDITGCPVTDFLGKEIGAYRDIIHPDDQEVVRNSIFEAFYSRRGFVVEYRIRHSNGLYRWVYESGQGSADPDGGIRLIDGVVIDITDQRQAEEQMWQLRKYLKNIIDSMPSAIIGVDPAGRVTQWNREAEKLTRFSADSVIGKRFFDIFPDLGFGMDNVRQAILNRTPGKYGKISLETDTMSFLADITVYPLVSNGVEGAVIRVDDVTDRSRMEELMIQSEKMLSIGGLAAGMAHEINNPLAAIIQNLQVIRSRLIDDMIKNEEAAGACGTCISMIADYSERRGILKMIDLSLSSGQRAASIIDNMLSFSRKEPARTEPFDMAEIIEKTLELAASDYDLKKSYDFRKIKIVKEYQPGLPLVPCEKNKMQQVFLNIFRNGAQAMFETGAGVAEPEFFVRMYVKRKMFCVEISDNGPGMDEETRKRVFEPFFTTKPVGQGTGLGLSLAYFIVTENHGGFMEAESEEGKGCKIIVRLPLSR